MDIHAFCKYDYETIRAVSMLSVYGKKSPKAHFLLITVIYGLGIFLCGRNFYESGVKLQLILALVMVGLYLFMCYLHFLLPRLRFKSMAKMQNLENEYIFGETSLKIKTRSESIQSETEVAYGALVKVFESSRYLFLFQSGFQAYPVNKATLPQGGAEAIRSKLGGLLGKKYYMCKY